MVILLLYCLAVSSPFLLGQLPYQDDAGRETMPQMQYYGKWLQQGRLSLWNNDLGSGYYQHASGQSAMLYPLNLILYRLLHWTTGYRASLVLHLLAACVFAYLFGTALGLSTLPAVLVALCAGGGGVMAAHQIHINIVMALSHVFAMLWLGTQWLRRDRPWPWALAGAAALGLSLLGGQPQYVWLAVLMLTLYGLVAWRSKAAEFCGLKALLGRAALVIVGGLGIGAAQVVPLYYYARRFPRPEPAGHYDFITAGSFEWADFARFFVPAAELKTHIGMAYWESCGYVGTAALLLAILCLTGGGPWTLRKRYGVALVAVGGLLMLGGNTPLYHLLADVPPLSFFRIPARNVLLVSLGLALLAADYLQGSLRPGAIKRERLQIGIVVAIVAVLTGIARPLLTPGNPSETVAAGLLGELILAGLILLAMATISLYARHTRNKLAWLTLAATALQLVLLWRVLNPTVPPEFWREPPGAAVVCHSRTVHVGERVACLQVATPTYPPAETFHSPVADWRDRLAANTCAVFAVPSALVGDAILPLAAIYTDTHLHGKSNNAEELADFCTRQGIKWVSMPPEPLRAPWVQPDAERPYLYENPDCVGPFYLCEKTVPGRGGFPRPAPIGGPYDFQRVTGRTEGPGAFLLEFTAPRAATLFIMQSHYPGWFAALDGRPAELGLAHPGGMFMQMPVPAGEHEVRLSFEPWDYDIGLGVTIATAGLMLLALWLWVSRRRRANRRY